MPGELSGLSAKEMGIAEEGLEEKETLLPPDLKRAGEMFGIAAISKREMEPVVVPEESDSEQKNPSFLTL